MSDLMRSCCGQDMKQLEKDMDTETGVLWVRLECQECDRLEWVRGFNAPQPSLFNQLVGAMVSSPVPAGAYL